MNVVKTLNLRMVARRVAVAANQLHSAQTRGLGGIKFLMDIRQEQDGARGMAQVFSNVTVGLHLTFGAYQGIEIAREQMSNNNFCAATEPEEYTYRSIPCAFHCSSAGSTSG